MKRFVWAAVAGLWCQLATAAPAPAVVHAEIDALLGTLQASGCQFNRNGSWYSGAEARDHLLRKLEYFEGKGAIQSTEQFIELAASRSSATGRPYQVRCGKVAPVESKVWLSAQLATVRSPAGKARP